jgi:pantetheine-phosphate adenylyltransferase
VRNGNQTALPATLIPPKVRVAGGAVLTRFLSSWPLEVLSAASVSGATLRKALVPGSFDPVHNGHIEVIERASRLFDEVLVASVRNPNKANALFTLEERRDMLAESTAHLDNVSIDFFDGLLVTFAEDQGCNAIVKGLRAVTDFETELQMAQMNERLTGMATLFIPTASRHSFLSSRLLLEVAKYGGDISSMVPEPVNRRLVEKLAALA